jgi:hypothetical protein
LLAFFRVAPSPSVSRGPSATTPARPTRSRAPARVETNSRDVGILKDSFEAASIEARTHFKRMGIVRYNAFDGVAGQQSYSLAILDENKTGFSSPTWWEPTSAAVTQWTSKTGAVATARRRRKGRRRSGHEKRQLTARYSDLSLPCLL